MRRRVSAWALPQALGHRLGEVGEQDGEPEPEGNLGYEQQVDLGKADQPLDQDQGGQDAADLDHEHDRS